MNIKLKLSNKVFKPTGTSEILFKSAVKHIKKSLKILDLGCGSGYVGIAIEKNTKHKNVEEVLKSFNDTIQVYKELKKIT